MALIVKPLADTGSVVPPKAGDYYVVQPGDTLPDILLRFGYANSPAEAGKMAIAIARESGLSSHDKNEWVRLTGLSTEKIDSGIRNRFGNIPPQIQFVHLRPQDIVNFEEGGKIRITYVSNAEYALRVGKPVDLVIRVATARVPANTMRDFLLKQFPTADLDVVLDPGNNFKLGQEVNGRVKIPYAW